MATNPEVRMDENHVPPQWGDKVSVFIKSKDSNKRRFGPVLVIVFLVFTGFALFFNGESTIVDRIGDSLSPSNEMDGLQSKNIALDIPFHSEMPVESNRHSKMVTKSDGIQIISLLNQKAIPEGIMIKAKLESGATNGLVKAILSESLMVDSDTLIPAGTTIIGRGQSGEDRLFVKFTKAVFKNGQKKSIFAQAFDGGDKILGLKGNKISKKAGKIAAAAGLGFLGGYLSGAGSNHEDVFLGMGRKKSARDGAMEGLATATMEQSRSLMDSMKEEKPVIEVNSGEVFWIVFDEEGSSGRKHE